MFASGIRRKRGERMRSLHHWRWHLDEVFVKINGVTHYLWRAVDHEREVLESFVSRRRNRKAALKFIKKTMKRHGNPHILVTDKLRSYGAAMKEMGNAGKQDSGQDTYYVGTMKGVGRIYQQTFVDTYSRVAMAKLYTEKTAITAADALNDKVLPLFAEHGIALLRVLTDRGTEYCGRVENHAYQLYLAVEDIDHSRTRANSPQTNGICERFHRTLKQEFYDIAFRKKLYTTLDELQVDLDEYLRKYNNQRPHSGKYCYGKTPMQTFRESLKIAREKNLSQPDLSDSNIAA